MQPNRCNEIALEIVEARRTVTSVPAPSTVEEGFGMADAYAVAAEVHQEWSALGHEQNGVKIGLTNARKWPSLGIDGPTWARTYRDTTTGGPAASVNTAALLSPRIEAEVLVGLSHALAPGASVSQVVEAVDWIALGFEIVDCHIPEWRVTAADLVADFGAHAGLVIGERQDLESSDVELLGRMDVVLTGGGSHHRGDGSEVVGGPVQAIAALLGMPHAPVLAAGFVVCTGALTGQAHAVTAGESWRLESMTGLLPPISLTFSEAPGAP